LLSCSCQFREMDEIAAHLQAVPELRALVDADGKSCSTL
jgi:hypothetical protein